MTTINQESFEIASVIKCQLYAGGILKVGSWGTHAFSVIQDGLQFCVSGRHFQGYIRIIYDKRNDLYNILFGQFKQNQWHEVKRFEEVSFDQMVDLIDEEVEYISAYKR